MNRSTDGTVYVFGDNHTDSREHVEQRLYDGISANAEATVIEHAEKGDERPDPSQWIYWACERRIHETITYERIGSRLEVLWVRSLIKWADASCHEGKFEIAADGKMLLRLLNEQTGSLEEQYHLTC